tara:strand:- start:104793 stop:107204 length:2412 start_codon:yes stop_codon:yes gene_type:complete
MHHIFTLIENEMFLSESGMNTKQYFFDFQTQQAFISHSEVSTIEREDKMFDPQNLQPIGNETKIPSKPGGNWQWEPSRNITSEWDDETGPNETTNLHQNFANDFAAQLEGYESTEYPNMYKRTVAQDTSTLKQGYYTTVEEYVEVGENLQLGKPFTMSSAYNPEGVYIGTPEDAKHICENMGILPMPISENSRVCSIGFSSKDNKWYGWSHRAMFGFKPGQSVKQGDCGFRPSNAQEAIDQARNFYSSEDREYKVRLDSENDKGFKLIITSPQHDQTGHYRPELNFVEEVPKGQGVYTISDQTEARQAAIHFAESVSSSEIFPQKHTTGLLSESAKKLVYTKYAWYKYVGKTNRRYRDHHPEFETTISTGEIFGIRLDKDGVHLVEDHDGEEFVLSEREAQLLIKNSKGFAGRRAGVKLLKGNGAIDQVVRRGVKSLTQMRTETVEVKPKTSTKRTKDPVFVAFFRHDANDPKYAFMWDTTEKDLRQRLDRFMPRFANLASSATIVKYSSDKASFLEKSNKNNLGYLVGPVVTAVRKEGRKVKDGYLPKGVTLYDETVEVPAYKDDWEPSAFVYPGNETSIMKELRKAIVVDKALTGIFTKETAKLDQRIGKTKSGKAAFVLVTDTVNKKFIEEAENFTRRLERLYGNALGAKMDLMAETSAPRISVTIATRMKPYPKEKTARCHALKKISQNIEVKSAITSKVSSLIEELRELERSTGKAALVTQKRNQLNRLSREYSKRNTLLIQTPIYTIKQGRAFVPVEVTGIDVENGEILYRLVRGRRGAGSQRATNLYSLDGDVQIF